MRYIPFILPFHCNILTFYFFVFIFVTTTDRRCLKLFQNSHPVCLLSFYVLLALFSVRIFSSPNSCTYFRGYSFWLTITGTIPCVRVPWKFCITVTLYTILFFTTDIFIFTSLFHTSPDYAQNESFPEYFRCFKSRACTPYCTLWNMGGKYYWTSY